MHRILAPALALGLAASAAQADCPVAEDLNAGIRVQFEDGVVIEYVATAPGIVDEAEVDPDGSRYHIITERGVLEVGGYTRLSGSKKDTDRYRYEYDFDTGAVFPPEPGKTGGGTQSVYDGKGELIDEVHVGYAFGAKETFTAGACEYEAVPVQINMRFAEDPALVVRLAYLPELDFAVVEGYYELGYDPTLYVPVSIEPM